MLLWLFSCRLQICTCNRPWSWVCHEAIWRDSRTCCVSRNMSVSTRRPGHHAARWLWRSTAQPELTWAGINSTHGSGALGCKPAEFEWLAVLGLVVSRRRWVTTSNAISTRWLKWQTLRMYRFENPDIRVDSDVGDVTTAPVLTELSRSWCEHETISLESVYCTIISTTFLVVVLEWCERRFDSVCWNIFQLANRVLILSFRTAQRERDIGNGGVCSLRTTNWILVRCPKTCRFWRGRIFGSWVVSTAVGIGVSLQNPVFLYRNHHKLSYKQLCRDMELTLMNVSAEQAFSLIELHERLNSLHFFGSFGRGSGNGEAEHVPQQFHCKEGFLDRCGECEQILMFPCVTYSLLGNAGIDLVDLDINEAGMTLSLRITSWSEAGERLRSRVTSWSGKTCTAGADSALRRVCPGRGNFGGSHGCHELPHSAVGAAQDRMDEWVVSVEDADVETETIVDLDASGVVQSTLLVGEQADATETTVSNRLEHGGCFVLLWTSWAWKGWRTTALRSCRRTLVVLCHAWQSGEKTVHHLGQKLYTSSTDALLAPATFNDLPLAKLSNDSFLLPVQQFFQWWCRDLCCDELEESDNRVVESFCLLSGSTQTDVAMVTAVFAPSPRLRGLSANT